MIEELYYNCKYLSLLPSFLSSLQLNQFLYSLITPPPSNPYITSPFSLLLPLVTPPPLQFYPVAQIPASHPLNCARMMCVCMCLYLRLKH